MHMFAYSILVGNDLSLLVHDILLSKITFLPVYYKSNLIINPST